MLIRKQTLRVSEVMKAIWLEKICLCPSDRVAIYTAKPYRRLKKRQGDPGAHLIESGSKRLTEVS